MSSFRRERHLVGTPGADSSHGQYRGGGPRGGRGGGGVNGGGGRRDIQDKYIAGLKEQNSIMQSEIQYLKQAAAEAQRARPSFEQMSATPAAAELRGSEGRYEPTRVPPIAIPGPGYSQSPTGGGKAHITVTSDSIDSMLAEIKKKAAKEKQDMEDEHRAVEEELEEMKVKFEEERQIIRMLKAEKGALHSQYLGELEQVRTSQQGTLKENESLKRKNQEQKRLISKLEEEKQVLEDQRQATLESSATGGEKMLRLEADLKKERINNDSLEKLNEGLRNTLQRAEVDKMQLQQTVTSLQAGVATLQQQIKGHQNESAKKELKMKQMQVQQKRFETIAEDHDDLIGKFHENQSKLVEANELLQYMQNSRKELDEAVLKATQERVAFRILLRGASNARKKERDLVSAIRRDNEDLKHELMRAQHKQDGSGYAIVPETERQYLKVLELENGELQAKYTVLNQEHDGIIEKNERLEAEKAKLAEDKARVVGQCEVLRRKVEAAKKLESVVKSMQSADLWRQTNELAVNLKEFLSAEDKIGPLPPDQSY